MLSLSAVSIPLTSPDDWIKFNINHTAFVRINYDQEGWRKITDIFRSSNESNQVSEHIMVFTYVHVHTANVLYTLVIQCNVYNTLYTYTCIVRMMRKT